MTRHCSSVRPVLLPTAILALGALIASPAAAEQASYDPKASITRFSDAGCLFDNGKVSGRLLDGQQIQAEKKGCLAILGSDGKTYYVIRAAKKATCPKRLPQGPVAAVTAGSAGANECKD